MHPQRNIFTFSKGLTVSSDFDSGNLWKCSLREKCQEPDQVTEQASITDQGYKQNDQENLNSAIQDEGILEFDIWISPDSLPYQKEITGYRTWYFFNITGILSNSKSLSFNIKNMSNQGSLFNYGLKPVTFEMSQQEHQVFLKSPSSTFYGLKWKQIPSRVEYKKGEEGLEVSYHYVLKKDVKETDFIYFAFTYPYSYQDVTRSIDEIQNRCSQRDDIYFNREILIKSVEGRNLELVTLTGIQNKLDEREQYFDEQASQLFPNRENEERPYKFDKPTVFITGRVHCGETPSSYIIQGLIDTLLDFQSPQTKFLLERFVFKIIHCLNIDGVSRGYWRNDTEGLNLNRTYSNPDPLLQPTIFASKLAILQQHQYGKLKYYTDFHAHANRRGCFVFGNSIPETEQAIEQMLFPKLMSLNCVNFDSKECVFSDEKNNVKDGKGFGRDGSGRAAIYRETKIVHCFTLEAHYATGVRVNPLKPRFDIEQKTKIIKESNPVNDVSSTLYKNKKTPIFNQEVFKDVGRAYLISILDYEEINPISRIVKNEKESLKEALDKLRDDLKREVDKAKHSKFKKANKGFKPTFELVMTDKGVQQVEKPKESNQEQILNNNDIQHKQALEIIKTKSIDDFDLNREEQQPLIESQQKLEQESDTDKSEDQVLQEQRSQSERAYSQSEEDISSNFK